MAIVFTTISQSLNISIQMCLLYGNISKFSYPGVLLPAATAGLIFKMYTENVGDSKTVAELGLYQSHRLIHTVSVLCTFYTYSSNESWQCRWALLYNVQSQDLFTVQLWLFTFPQGKPFMGFIKKLFYVWSVVLVSLLVLRVSLNDTGELKFTRIYSQRMWSSDFSLFCVYVIHVALRSLSAV